MQVLSGSSREAAHSPSQSMQSPQESWGCNFFPPKQGSFSKVVASNHSAVPSKKPSEASHWERFVNLSTALVITESLSSSRILLAELPTRDQHWDSSPKTLPWTSPQLLLMPKIILSRAATGFSQKLPSQRACGWMCRAEPAPKAALLLQNSEVHQRLIKSSLSHPKRRDKTPRASLHLLPASSVCLEGRR